MAPWITPGDAAQLHASNLNLAILFRMKSTGNGLKLWSGHGDFLAPVDPLEPLADRIYRGVGDVLALPEISQLLNGEADRVQFSLSGIGETAAALADNTADEIAGSSIRLGIAVLDGKLQPSTGILWLWFGEADVLTPEYDGLTQPPTYTLTLSAGTQTVSRRRNAVIYYSDTQQQQRSPGDLGCSRVTTFTSGHKLPWPVF